MTQWQAPPTQLSLDESKVHLWLTELVRPPERVSQLRQLLSDDERVRADRFHFERDRIYYTIGRGILRELLAQYLAVEPTDIEFGYNKYGKPILEAAPSATPQILSSLSFNVSHSGQMVLYGLAWKRSIGVDIEWHRDNISPFEIAKGFFSPVENQTLNSLQTTAEHFQAFYNCWTRKEAYIKAHGMGLSMPLDSFDVTLAPGDPARLVSTRPNVDEVNQWIIDAVPVPTGYTAAIALENINPTDHVDLLGASQSYHLSAFRF